MAPPSPPRSNPYSNVPDVASDPRQVEGWALMEVAVRMRAAQREPIDLAAVINTAKLNRQLWTIFQANLLEPDCQVPEQIRTQLLTLSKFIDKHTLRIITDPQPEMLDVLMRINREIAGGLMTAPSALEAAGIAAESAATAAPPVRPSASPPPAAAPASPYRATAAGAGRRLTDTRA